MDGRASSFMPAIKCSTCGFDVEISMMGEHVCGAPLIPEPMPPMPSMDRLNQFSGMQAQSDKFGRVPPRVDTSAANRSYMAPPQLTPVSASTGSRSISPRTPNGRAGAGGSGDDYFSPAIMGTTPPPQSRRPNGYGGFGEPEPYEVDSMYAPAASPKRQGGGLLQRMNTIAPGPFNTDRRPSASSRNMFAPSNDRGSSADNLNDTQRSFGANERPGTAASYGSSGGIAPPRVPRKNGYGGFGPPSRGDDDFEPAPFGSTKRSETFPKQSEQIEAPARTPSAPGFRQDRYRRPTNENNERPVMTNDFGQRPLYGMGPDTSRAPPPRTSLTRPPTRGQVASINLADEFGVGNPYHSPSASQSSNNSGYSDKTGPSQPSSNSSPSRSMRNGRKPSDTSNFDGLMKDLESSMQELQPKELPSAPKQPPPPPKDRNVAGSGRAENRRPLPSELSFDRDDPAVQGPRRDARRPPPSPRLQNYEPRKNDPAIQGARGHARRPSQDPAIQNVSRKTCKACGLGIQGKSISSADGRLTGRYHKACFVCTTCSEPFSSSTFYVLNDKPYCEHHYHKLNGSLCGTCKMGIEGQYLEDEALIKYHPGCFRCGDCGIVLSDGYFEVNGKAYCERDAWKRLQPAPQPMLREPPMGAGRPPGAFGARPGPNMGGKMGPRGGYGLPNGTRMSPLSGLAPPSGMPRMAKRMTRLGMM